MIFERQAELAAAARLLDDLTDGACALLLEGDPGIGKTALIETVGAEAVARGIRTLSCRPSERELQLPHAALIELLADVEDDALSVLPAPQRRALLVALRRMDPGDVASEWQTVAAGLATLLADLAGSSPLLLVLDDIHWLDPAGAQAVELAVRRAKDSPVGVLAGARIGEGPAPRAVERAVPPGRLRRVLMGPLSERALTRLVTQRTAACASDEAVQRIVRGARGNPLAAIEMARALGGAAEQAPDAPPPLPGDITGLVSRRLASLPSGVREVLLLAACMPGDQPLEGSQASLAPAEAAGIVRLGADGVVIFTHPLYRTAVLALSTAQERRGAHAKLAAGTDDPEQRARHLAIAADGPDGEVAAALEAASALAANRGAPMEAADLAERAWRLTPAGHDAAAARRVLRACELRARAGHHAELPRILEEVLGVLRGPPLGHAMRLMAETMVWQGRTAEAVGLLEESLVQLDADPAGAAEAHMDLAHATYHAGYPGRVVLANADRAVTRAEEAGPGGPLPEALTVRAVTAWRTVGGIDEPGLTRAVAHGGRDRRARVHQRAHVVRAVMRGLSGDMPHAMDVLSGEIARSLTVGAVTELPYLTVYLGTFAAMTGDETTLVRSADRCTSAAEEMGSAMVESSRTLLRALVLTASGDAAGAREEGCRSLDAAMATGLRGWVPWLAWVLGRVELATGDARAADAWLRPALELHDPRVDPGPDPSHTFFVPEAAEAMGRTGDVHAALGLLEPYEHRCRELGRAWLTGACVRVRALLLSLDGDLDGAVAVAGEAVERLDGLGFPTELGRAHLVLGGIERRRRQRGAARAALQTAHDLFAANAGGIWRIRAAEELGRTWSRSPTGTLSPSEMRMARLAAEGLDNPSIAARLFVTRRTVEATLSRAYRKLGITGRAGLHRALGGLHREDDPRD
ncbi:MAG: AAA family ATPase [Thermoleophilia bacterium]|nr:AAA family ATPase [Thermoleophilia bacterium]